MLNEAALSQQGPADLQPSRAPKAVHLFAGKAASGYDGFGQGGDLQVQQRSGQFPLAWVKGRRQRGQLPVGEGKMFAGRGELQGRTVLRDLCVPDGFA